ncbi:MAG: dihydropteroate synthase [Gammaproteobacteria bacterium]
MGVLNVTPDSFSDGGRHQGVPAALAHARRMVEEGAAIIDVGGESTRPGAAVVPVEEELDRVVPVIEAIRRDLDVLVSVDTSQPAVIAAAVAAGAGLVNDVRGLRRPGALAAAAASGAAVCLMHMQGEPDTMQQSPCYDDVVTEVREWLVARLEVCRQAGLPTERLLVDPGFGLGKTVEHNLRLLAELPAAVPAGVPVLVGLSRKSTIGIVTGRPVDGRIPGSVAAAALAVRAGANIVRAHDVAATVDAVKVAWAVRQATAR